jgi:hypothetical protein
MVSQPTPIDPKGIPMTHDATASAVPAPVQATGTQTSSTHPARARWSTLGGGGLVASFGLLLVATLLEYGLLAAPTEWTPLTGVFLALFAVSLLLALLAVVALALGSTGSDGIVGRSTLGRVALIAYGVLWLAMETLYLVAVYVVGDADLLAVTGVLGVLMSVSSIIAAVVIAVKGVAVGVGRWSMIAAIVVSAVTGGAATGTGDALTITVLHGISALGMLLVGVSYLVDRGARRGAIRR